MIMTNETTDLRGNDMIDSREVTARIEAIEADPDVAADTEELAALKALVDGCEGYSDWSHGAALIRDSYFVQYAQDLAEDIAGIKPNAGWPFDHIDWDAAADALRDDYNEVDFDGTTYWIRS